MFEDIIPAIIFLIFLLPALYKKIKKPVKSKEKKSAEKKTVLGDLFQQIKDQMEKSMGATKPPEQTMEPQDLTDDEFLFDDIMPEPEPVAVLEEPQHALKPEPLKKKAVVHRKYSHKSLKHAVIWSEILRKPLALRDAE